MFVQKEGWVWWARKRRHLYPREWHLQREGDESMDSRELIIQTVWVWGLSYITKGVVLKSDHVIHIFEITLCLSGTKPCMAHNVIWTWSQSTSLTMIFTLFSLNDSLHHTFLIYKNRELHNSLLFPQITLWQPSKLANWWMSISSQKGKISLRYCSWIIELQKHTSSCECGWPIHEDPSLGVYENTN